MNDPENEPAKEAFDEYTGGADSAPEQAAEERAHDTARELTATAKPQPVAVAVTSENENAAVLAASRKHTRRAFVVTAAAAAAGAGFYTWLDRQKQLEMQPALVRRVFNLNAAIFDGKHKTALTPTYPLSRAETLRINGVAGLAKPLVAESWRLQLAGVRDAAQSPRYTHDITAWEYRYAAEDPGEDKGHNSKTASDGETSPEDGKNGEDDNKTGRKPRGLAEAGESDSTLPKGTPGLLLTLPDITRLPRHELVTQFKCIEGWSQIVHWSGVRMADFLEAYPPALIDGKPARYVYMETPDGDYYTGYDMDVCRHPQTLLVTEMMGAPLTANHGAPLRLHMPIKYGYKQIKRIGLIAYTNDKPDDYWTKLGYDWYAGL